MLDNKVSWGRWARVCVVNREGDGNKQSDPTRRSNLSSFTRTLLLGHCLHQRMIYWDYERTRWRNLPIIYWLSSHYLLHRACKVKSTYIYASFLCSNPLYMCVCEYIIARLEVIITLCTLYCKHKLQHKVKTSHHGKQSKLD